MIEQGDKPKMLTDAEQRQILGDGLPRCFTLGKTMLRHKFSGKLYKIVSLARQDWKQGGRPIRQIELKADDGDTFKTNEYLTSKPGANCRSEVARLFESVDLIPTGSDWVI